MACAVSKPDPAPDAAEILGRRYRELLPAGATVGVSIVSLNSGRTVFACLDTVPLIPASVLKLIVTGHAIDRWDARWDSTVSRALTASRAPALRFLRDDSKSDSLTLLLDAPDAAAWPLRRRAVFWANRHSTNRLSELLLAAALDDRTPAGATACYTTWLDSLAVPSAGLRMHDGSGLARANRLTPATVTGLLAALHETRERELGASLAAPGRRGTLARRGLGLGHRVRAKTGYIREVFTLAGYLEAETDTYAFAFLANDCPDPRAAYRLFTGLLLATYRRNAADTLRDRNGTGAAKPPR